jgi:nitroreductase
MGIYDIISKKRTIRLFKQEKIDYKILEKCVNAARFSSSAKNNQPLEYVIIDDEGVLQRIIPLLNFGGFISEDKKAKKGNEPVALIVIILKKDANKYYQYDVGIAAQNISLVLYENGIGSCIMGSIDNERIKEELKIPDDYFVDLVISLGYPEEEPIVEESDSETDYYRKGDVLHIPKRKLDLIIHRNRF